MQRRIRESLVLLSLVTLTIVIGCRKESEDTATETAEATQPAKLNPPASVEKVKPIEDLPALEAILAKADAMDGTTDHVVSKCGMCALRMDGSDAHVSKVGDYELHFCSEECKESFDEDSEKAILTFAVE